MLCLLLENIKFVLFKSHFCLSPAYLQHQELCYDLWIPELLRQSQLPGSKLNKQQDLSQDEVCAKCLTNPFGLMCDELA